MRFEMIEFEEPDLDGHRYSFAALGDHQYGSPDEFHTVRAWCVEHFGPTPTERYAYPGTRWVGIQYFYFRDRDDAMLFRLRWC